MLAAIHIRVMTLDDLANVTVLASQLGYPASLADVRDRFTRLTDDPDNGLYVAEDEQGAFLGWLHVHGRHSLESDAFAEIGGLVVDAAHRRRGVASALVDAARSWARERAYPELRVRSNAQREEAHQFYPAVGFELIKTQRVYRQDL